MCVHASVDAACVEAVVSHLTWVLGSESGLLEEQ